MYSVAINCTILHAKDQKQKKSRKSVMDNAHEWVLHYHLYILSCLLLQDTTVSFQPLNIQILIPS